eukprot:TRINITY_DN14886_c2_g1_i1.p1 TRINITY_DN14886_c2_g1~~TRINITY_DN14886_c2_g1_i1.p1  ORF type:complete len:185 (+),score=-21.47 TRINITY_DN14886_c2_g1_i1:497-1051(+)
MQIDLEEKCTTRFLLQQHKKMQKVFKQFEISIHRNFSHFTMIGIRNWIQRQRISLYNVIRFSDQTYGTYFLTFNQNYKNLPRTQSKSFTSQATSTLNSNNKKTFMDSPVWKICKCCSTNQSRVSIRVTKYVTSIKRILKIIQKLKQALKYAKYTPIYLDLILFLSEINTFIIRILYEFLKYVII